MEENNEQVVENNSTSEKVLSLDELLQERDLKSQYDKKVNDLLERQKKDLFAKWEEKAETEKKEAQRLAKLTAEEKLAEKEKALKEREEQLSRKELISETEGLLKSEGLPVSFAKSIVTKGIKAEDIKVQIEELKGSFNDELEKAVKLRMAGNTPKGEKQPVNENDTLRRAFFGG